MYYGSIHNQGLVVNGPGVSAHSEQARQPQRAGYHDHDCGYRGSHEEPASGHHPRVAVLTIALGSLADALAELGWTLCMIS